MVRIQGWVVLFLALDQRVSQELPMPEQTHYGQCGQIKKVRLRWLLMRDTLVNIKASETDYSQDSNSMAFTEQNNH